MIDYPASLPLDAATTLIDIVKNRKIGERKVEAGKAVWNLQGYAQRMLLGDNEVGYEGVDPVNDLNTFVELHTELTALEREGIQFGANGDAEAGNVMVVISIIGVVVQLIQLIRNRKKDEENA